jgi:hypothetical protein
MKKLLLSFSFITAIIFPAFSQTPTWAWEKYGGDTKFNTYGYAVATDSTGNVYVTGSFGDTAVFGGIKLFAKAYAGLEIFLVKYDPNGNILWAKQTSRSTPNGNSEYSRGIAVDATGNAYIVGEIEDGPVNFGSIIVNPNQGQSNAFIAKYDKNGNAIWVQQGIPPDHISGSSFQAVSFDHSGNLVVTGWLATNSFPTNGGPIAFGSQSLNGSTSSGFGADILLAKYDTNGNCIWAKQAGLTNGYPFGKGIAADASDNIYITGYFTDTAATFGSYTVYNSGSTGGSGRKGVFVAKYDASGNALWARSGSGVGGSGESQANGISVDGSGNCYITGQLNVPVTFGSILLSSSTRHIFTVKYNTSGTVIWAQQAGTNGSGYDVAYAICADAAGNSYITGNVAANGTFGSIVSPGYGGFVAAYDPSGIAQWVAKTSGDEQGNGICIHKGYIFVAGQLATVGNPPTFGTDTVKPPGSYLNAYVAKLSGAINGINEIKESFNTVVFYPNPSNGIYTISLQNSSGESKVEIYNMLGEQIYRSNLNEPTALVNISAQANGVYMYHVIKEGHLIGSGKLVIR